MSNAPISPPYIAELRQEIAQLRAEVAMLKAQRMAFDAPVPTVTIEQRKRYEFAAQLARPRQIVRIDAHNTQTGQRVTCAGYSRPQVERFALRFSRLPSPTRTHWRGDRTAFGIMRDLFAAHGAIVIDHGTKWSWAAGVWPGERRMIAMRIAQAAH